MTNSNPGPIFSHNTSVTDRQTDRWTDERQTTIRTKSRP